MKANALLCTVGTSMFARMADLRTQNPQEAAARSTVRLPRDASGDVDRLEVWYGDGRAVTKLNVWTTARTNRELASARLHLERALETDPR